MSQRYYHHIYKCVTILNQGRNDYSCHLPSKNISYSECRVRDSVDERKAAIQATNGGTGGRHQDGS